MSMKDQSKESRRRTMILGLEKACAASADIIFAAVADEKGRMKREKRAYNSLVANEDVRNRETQVRTVAAVVSRENSEEIQEQVGESLPSLRSSSNRKRRLTENENNKETRNRRTAYALPQDATAQLK